MDEPRIPFLQIRPGCLLLYDMSYWNYLGSVRTWARSNNALPVNVKYTGKMNEKSRSKLRFAINLLVAQARWKQVENPTSKRLYKFKINFITLTLSAPQMEVSDKMVKSKMLEPWLKNMRNVYKLRSYVWRAERQKNGNIHFHVTTDSYIPYEAIRDVWNFQQAKFHFITHFQNRNNSVYPNSTDVHSVANIKNLASYLVKYMVKDEKGLDTIEGKVWDCSLNLKLRDRVTYEMSPDDYSLMRMLIEKFPDQLISTDNCSIFQLSEDQMKLYLPANYFDDYKTWLDGIYHAADPPGYNRIESDHL
jgi:hypothetical protein